MTLATHIIVGAAGAKLFAQNPIQGFVIGWLSHYILDSIIHWDYALNSTKTGTVVFPGGRFVLNRAILSDVVKVVLDVCIGFALVFIFLRDSALSLNLLAIAGALGGCVPDFLQFIFAAWKTKPVELFQRFHQFMHAERDLNDRHVLGFSIQLVLVAVIFVLFKLQ